MISYICKSSLGDFFLNLPKIYLVIGNDFPEGNAKNSRIKSYAEGLKNLGHEVEVLVGFSSAFNLTQTNREARGTWNNIPFRFLSKQIEYKTYTTNRIKCWLKANYNLFRCMRKPKNQGAKWLFYMPGFRALLPALLIARKKSSSIFCLETELLSLESTGFEQSLNRMEERLKARFFRILVLTPMLKNWYQALKPKHTITQIVPISGNIQRFIQRGSAEIRTNCIGYVGSFGDKDGVATIVETFLKYQQQHEQARLILFGYGLKVYSDHPNIEQYGKFEYEDLPKLLLQCDTLVLNRRDDLYARLGFPIKLVEYLATAIPVVLCDFEDYHEYLTPHEVIYFKPNNVKSMLKAFEWRYSNYDKADAVGRNGYKKCTLIFDQKLAAKELSCIFA
ncbi:MAG: glycosyltransferase involved in cell wall biosynthesis [Bacteroidia bacterium]